MAFSEFYDTITEKKEYKIFIDMDGVITDFKASFNRIDPNVTLDDMTNEPDPIFWKFVKKGGLNFWENMPWTKDGKKLWKYLKPYTPTILSSPSHRLPDSIKGKKSWIKREVNNNPYILARAIDKQKQAQPNAILIDDLKKNIDQWNKAGGIGILHTSTESTIKQLNKILNQNESLNYRLGESEQLDERLLTFSKKENTLFNQVVILAGGAGSGKGHIYKTIMGLKGIVFDVDELKKLVVASKQFRKKVPELETFHKTKDFLKNPDNVERLHSIVSDLGIADTKLQSAFNSVNVADPKRKPNLIFDVTLKSLKKLETITKQTAELGYEKENIHIVWILNEIEIAKKQNLERERVVPEHILLDTHKGAAKTVIGLLKLGSKLRNYMDGKLYVVFNRFNIDKDFILLTKDRGKAPLKSKGILQLMMSKLNRSLNPNMIKQTKNWIKDLLGGKIS